MAFEKSSFSRATSKPNAVDCMPIEYEYFAAFGDSDCSSCKRIATSKSRLHITVDETQDRLESTRCSEEIAQFAHGQHTGAAPVCPVAPICLSHWPDNGCERAQLQIDTNQTPKMMYTQL